MERKKLLEGRDAAAGEAPSPPPLVWNSPPRPQLYDVACRGRRRLRRKWKRPVVQAEAKGAAEIDDAPRGGLLGLCFCVL